MRLLIKSKDVETAALFEDALLSNVVQLTRMSLSSRYYVPKHDTNWNTETPKHRERVSYYKGRWGEGYTLDCTYYDTVVKKWLTARCYYVYK